MKSKAAGSSSNLPGWFRNVLISLFVTFLIYFSLVYIHYGEVFIEYNYTIPLELTFTFLYFLALFWAHRRISGFIHSGVLKNIHSVGVYVIEGLIVTITTFILNNVIMFFPLWVLLFYLNAAFDEDHVRMHYIIQMIVSLFFYYFVEKERIRKQLREELLRTARLQRENFHSRLQHLKNKVNPHFLFSSLNALDSLIPKDKDLAVEFVNKLSYVYRSFLETKEELVSLSDEKELTEAYVFLLKVRYGDRIKLQMDIPSDYSDYQLPPGSLRLPIEDAEANNTPNSGNILSIRIYCEGKFVLVESSINRNPKDPANHQGLLNIRNRYEFLTDLKVKTERKNGSFIVRLPLLSMASHGGDL